MRAPESDPGQLLVYSRKAQMLLAPTDIQKPYRVAELSRLIASTKRS